MVDHTLRHGQGTIPDVDREEQLALGVHRDPDPLGRPLQAFNGLGRADLAGLHRAEERKHLIELHLVDADVVQEVLHEGPQLLGRLHQPLQHRVGVHLEHPRRASDTQAFGQAADDPYDEVRRGPLAVKDGAEGLQEVAATGDAEQLAPGTATGMAVGTEIAPAHPAPIGTVGVGAEMRGGVDLAPAPPRGDDARGWSCGGWRLGVGRVLTGVAVRFVGEAHKRGGLTAALGPWGGGLRCWRAHGSVGAGPRPLEHEAQPHQGDEYRLVKKEMGDHGKIPSQRWSNEGILPGLAGYRISRRIQVHDPAMRCAQKAGGCPALCALDTPGYWTAVMSPSCWRAVTPSSRPI